MQISAINNQNFEAKKFRLPLKKLDFSQPEYGIYGITKDVNLVKEYSNPNAKDLYKKAQIATNIKEKIELFKQMGDYEILDYGAGIEGFFRKLFNKPKGTGIINIR